MKQVYILRHADVGEEMTPDQRMLCYQKAKTLKTMLGLKANPSPNDVSIVTSEFTRAILTGGALGDFLNIRPEDRLSTGTLNVGEPGMPAKDYITNMTASRVVIIVTHQPNIPKLSKVFDYGGGQNLSEMSNLGGVLIDVASGPGLPKAAKVQSLGSLFDERPDPVPLPQREAAKIVGLPEPFEAPEDETDLETDAYKDEMDPEHAELVEASFDRLVSGERLRWTEEDTDRLSIDPRNIASVSALEVSEESEDAEEGFVEHERFLDEKEDENSSKFIARSYDARHGNLREMLEVERTGLERKFVRLLNDVHKNKRTLDDDVLLFFENFFPFGEIQIGSIYYAGALEELHRLFLSSEENSGPWKALAEFCFVTLPEEIDDYWDWDEIPL